LSRFSTVRRRGTRFLSCLSFGVFTAGTRDKKKPTQYSAKVGAFHDWATLNLAKRRLCDALGTSRGCAAPCCAISIARARAAITASIPRSNRPLARRANFGAAKSCSLVIFMIAPRRPKAYSHRFAAFLRPYHLRATSSARTVRTHDCNRTTRPTRAETSKT
jgi:hypothetical protein